MTSRLLIILVASLVLAPPIAYAAETITTDTTTGLTGVSSDLTDPVFPLISSGGDFVPLAPIPGLTEDISATQSGIATFLDNLYTFIIGIAVILAIGMIIWGGFEYALSEAITSKTEGRKKIQQALFGLVLVLSPVLVFTIINPAILNLDLNIPPLNTALGNYSPPAAPETTPGGVTKTSTTYTACSDNTSCDSAYSTCRTNQPSGYLTMRSITCRKSDGVVSSRTDYGIPYVSTYACASTETLNVECYYLKVTL